MFGKVKNTFNDIKRIARERVAEVARKERERVQAEKDALMALSEKELLVEVIMSLNDLKDSVDSLKWSVSSIDSKIHS